MVKLGVNIDHVATLREARGGVEPDILQAACDAVKGGADGITVHLREDRRHIQDKDVFLLKKKIDVPLNLEMSLNGEIVEIAKKVRPNQATIVPEKRRELTTEGGLDVIENFRKVKKVVRELKDKGIKVSLFIDPVVKQVEASFDAGADAVELHTGAYSEKFGRRGGLSELKKLFKAAKCVNLLGVQLNAGHGLNYVNVFDVLKLPKLYELNIGHSVISRAVFVGLERAVSEMKQACARKCR